MKPKQTEDERIWSNTFIDGTRLTWRELAKRYEAEISYLHKWKRICMDLDRCEHGRHEGDYCSGCGGPSHGNPCGVTYQIGYGLAGETIIIMPPRGERHDPDAWCKSVNK